MLHRHSATARVITLLAVCIGFVMPMMVLAQSADLRATIRAELMNDPRSAQLSGAELDAMVNALAAEAQEKGISPNDIAWRPQAEVASYGPDAGAGGTCDGFPEFFCTVRHALGFDGSNVVIPIGLLVTSGLLWFLLHELRLHHRKGLK